MKNILFWSDYNNRDTHIGMFDSYIQAMWDDLWSNDNVLGYYTEFNDVEIFMIKRWR